MSNMFRSLILCLLLSVLSFAACEKNTPVKKVIPIDASKTKAIINGRECHMFPGYYSDPDNRTFAGQENQDNIYMFFYSQNMAENYLARNYRDNDTLYRIVITFYAPKKDFHSNTKFFFNRIKDSTEVWVSQFEDSVLNNYVLYGRTSSYAIAEHKHVSYIITDGWVSFGNIEVEPHLLYGSDRYVWKSEEAFFEFDAVSEDGRIMHVNEGYTCLY